MRLLGQLGLVGNRHGAERKFKTQQLGGRAAAQAPIGYALLCDERDQRPRIGKLPGQDAPVGRQGALLRIVRSSQRRILGEAQHQRNRHAIVPVQWMRRIVHGKALVANLKGPVDDLVAGDFADTIYAKIDADVIAGSRAVS